MNENNQFSIPYTIDLGSLFNFGTLASASELGLSANQRKCSLSLSLPCTCGLTPLSSLVGLRSQRVLFSVCSGTPTLTATPRYHSFVPASLLPLFLISFGYMCF